MIYRTHTANYQCLKIQQLARDCDDSEVGRCKHSACGRLPVDFLIFVRPNAARG